MSALEKILALSQQPTMSNAVYEPASELVLAALEDLRELRLVLAAADDEPPAKKQQGKDGGSTSQGGKGAKKPAKGSDAADDEDDDEDDDTPPWLKKKKKNKVKASALAEAAIIALSGLAVPEASCSWVERTSSSGTVALSGGPYGNAVYADPGHRRDGKKRYPLDTEYHVRLSWSHIAQDDQAGAYEPAQLASIRGKIRNEARRRGIEIGDEPAAVALSRGGKPAGPPVAMHHGPFHGTHSHGHAVMDVHEHDHSHNGDSEHDRHHGGAASYRDY